MIISRLIDTIVLIKINRINWINIKSIILKDFTIKIKKEPKAKQHRTS